jgi:predicted metal-dependent phosphoesterase TrpH
MKLDLHVHSRYSYDSLLNPGTIIKMAKKRDLDGVAIVDHNTIRGGIETLKLNDDLDFQVIVGAEIKTEYGDIIGLFLNEEIRNRKLIEVLEEITLQGGLSVLAHPYRQYSFPEALIDSVDVIEGFNARSTKEANEKGYALGARFNKPMIAGSDVHLSFEIGKGVTLVNSQIRESLKNGDTTIYGSESNYYLVHSISVAIERVKFWKTRQQDITTL